MTIPEITAYVMALPAEELRRLTATEIMGWTLGFRGREAHEYEVYEKADRYIACEVASWRPDIDRNQSRMVTDKVGKKPIREAMRHGMAFNALWSDITPLDESRAALIAHMIHTEEAKNATEQ